MKENTRTRDNWFHLIYRKKIVAFFVHWIFQGILYADKTEKVFKIFIDVCLTLFFFFVFINFIDNSMSIILAFIIAHTFNATLNGQMFVVARHFGESRNFQDLTNYIEGLKERISNERSIQAAAIYGSFSRGEAKESSDLDVRIIRRRGIVNGLRACSFGLFERSRALFNKFPLDLYVVDTTKHLSKLRDDEIPIVLYDPELIFEKLDKEVTYFV